MIKRLLASLKTEFTQESIIFLVAMILRCWYIDTAPFWYDEGFSAILARLGTLDMIRATAGDVHPPLYYLLLGGWARLMGDSSAFVLRQLSACLGIIAIWQIQRLCVRFELSRYNRLLVLTLAALSPVMILYSQEARMYALLTCLILEAWIQIIDRRYWAVGLCVLAMLYSHNYGILYGACLALIAFLRGIHRPREIYHAGDPDISWHDVYAMSAGFVLPVLLYLPWAVYGLSHQLGIVGGNFWTGYVLPMTNILNTTTLLVGPKAPPVVVIVIAALAVGLLPVAILQTLKAKHASWVILALGPGILAALISVWRPIYLVRGMVPILPAWYLIVALMLRKTVDKPTILKYALAFVYIVGLAMGLVLHLGSTYVGLQKFNPLQFNTQIPIRAGVPVIHIGDFSMVNWMASRPEIRNQLYLSPCPPLPGELSAATRAAMGMIIIQPDQLPDEYYLVPYFGNLSNACQEQQYRSMTAGLEPIYLDPWQYGEGGVYYHAKP